MKRILLSLICGIFLIGMITGCDDTKNSNNISNFTNADIIINGNKYTLPVDFSELEKKENLELDDEMYITELESFVSFDSSLYLNSRNVFNVTF